MPIPAPTIGIRNYAIVTAAYWAFTLTDGALRMLVLLHFNQLGYTPVQLAFLFLLYEFFGIVTNLVGGWVASRTGLRFTLVLGLGLQVVALGLLAALNQGWTAALSVAYVMGCQALSGIAKDLTKMSAKSAVKVLVPAGDESGLFKWVAVLTGSKNALKGAGFFVGGVLLSVFGFRSALAVMAGGVFVVLLLVLAELPGAIGQARKKAAFSGVLSNSSGINRLSLARLALFAARDVWFVVSVPVFLASVLGWAFTQVGGFMALWVIAYGGVQSLAPVLLRKVTHGNAPSPGLAAVLGLGLAGITALIPIGLEARHTAGADDAGRAHDVRRRVRAEFVGPFVLGSGVFGSRPRLDERRFLLHGECGRPTAWNVAVWRVVSAGRRRRVSVGSRGAGRRRRRWSAVPSCSRHDRRHLGRGEGRRVIRTSHSQRPALPLAL